jgi:hypothetical protein
MKNRNTNTRAVNHTTQFNKNKPSPEIRDNLDSRKNEEQDSKGDDITHNRKAHHGKSKKSKDQSGK